MFDHGADVKYEHARDDPSKYLMDVAKKLMDWPTFWKPRSCLNRE